MMKEMVTHLNCFGQVTDDFPKLQPRWLGTVQPDSMETVWPRRLGTVQADSMGTVWKTYLLLSTFMTIKKPSEGH